MAFQQFKLTRSINQTRGIFDKYIYNPDNNDLIADILSVGYFNESRYIDSEDWIGSIIEVSASDGYAIVRIVSGGTVALYDSTSAGASGMPLAPAGQLSVGVGSTWVNSAQVSGVPVYSYTEVAISAQGLILLDNSDLSLVTQITVSKEGINGADSSALFEKLTYGDVVSVSDYLDNTNFMIANVTGDAVDAGLTFQIPVAVADSNGALTTGELTSLSISPAAGRDKAYIILESTTTQAMSTDQANPTVLDSWVVLDSNGISLQGDSIRNDTGRLISSMSGTIGIHPLVDGGGGSRLLSLTSERSPDGIAYSINNQNRPIYTTNNAETYNTKESYLTNFVDGEYIRFIAFASGTMSIAPSSATFRNQAITGPAALWILVES